MCLLLYFMNGKASWVRNEPLVAEYGASDGERGDWRRHLALGGEAYGGACVGLAVGEAIPVGILIYVGIWWGVEAPEAMQALLVG